MLQLCIGRGKHRLCRRRAVAPLVDLRVPVGDLLTERRRVVDEAEGHKRWLLQLPLRVRPTTTTAAATAASPGAALRRHVYTIIITTSVVTVTAVGVVMVMVFLPLCDGVTSLR
ncbi:hypothetical protein DQ04_15591020 [Trypanosoma grayi]|uniref:hypothetical protein n=1 Tax=Trypanosoma grayi TaxID=71804 RepID=UPI0004F41389|nr:hypothetical protein DQ04_15591020 [Trypanosoma grayi]KEG06158.1 hypothetical protein DQ04_15591020 [Trypanosoma grayi]